MKFVDTKDILHYEEYMITKADKVVMIFSPYLKISESMGKILLNEYEEYPSKDIFLICGKEKLYNAEYSKIQQIIKASKNAIKLFFNPRLHAKIMLNENYALISSMNLYETSENNHEAGIYFSSRYSSEKSAFQSLTAYCENLFDSDETIPYTEEISIQNRYSYKRPHSLTDDNFQWLRVKQAELGKDSWYELQNDIINQAKTSFYELTSVSFNKNEIICEHGLVEKIKELYEENQKLRKELEKLS